MKTSFLTAVLFILGLTTSAFAQQAKLEGHVYTHTNAAVAGVRIVAPGGQAAVTSTKGRFLIAFASPIQPGQATRIEMAKPGWVIYEPMLGNCVTQSAARNYQPMRVIIVPKGSPLALSPKRLSQVVAQWATERSKQAKEINSLHGEVKGLKRELDEYAFLRKYAQEYGFTLKQFESAAEQWARLAESKDKYEQALKEYFLKNYGHAAQLARESALIEDEKLDRIIKERREASLKIINGFKLEGNSHYEQSKYREALASYSEIDKRFTSGKIPKEEFTEQWGEVKLLMGDAKHELGTKAGGEESNKLLSESVAEYRQALSVYTREALPQQWAITQNNLGVALRSRGERLGGEEGVRLLAEAVQAFGQALSAYTPEATPQQWAMTQNNLGNALRSQGERLGGEQGARLLAEGVEAFRQALTVRARDALPQDWAATQNNLGNALSSQGERLGGEQGVRLLAEAVEAYNRALTVYTRETLPQDWAITQNNLGTALGSQGERVGGEDGVRMFAEAVDAYNKALSVRTRDALPQQWAMTQNNLGNALWAKGERVRGEQGARLLAEAVEAYGQALTVYNRETFPQDWARTQNNLGAALLSRGERVSGEEGVRLLGEAIEAFRQALTVYTREALPQQWATTQNNLGNALRPKGERVRGEQGARLLAEAVEAYGQALSVRTRDALPQDWAATQNNLGVALRSQSGRASGEEAVRLLGQAVEAFRKALTVYTREALPQGWAMTQTNLGLTYTLLKDWANAAQSFVNVLTIYPKYAIAYQMSASIYHGNLFNYAEVFRLNQQWLENNPGDLAAEADFAENHFTTARFTECEQRIGKLLARPDMETNAKVVLRTIEIANLIAMGKTNLVPAKMGSLISAVSSQPADFQVRWQFDGTRHFIGQHEKLASHRAWVIQLLEAIGGGNREEILKGLNEVRAKFKQ